MESLRLERVNKWFGKQQVLHDINLEVAANTFCVFLGPSGCGKSTLLNIVAGLESPTDGRVVLGDRDITRLAPHRRNMAMVFQNYALYPHLTVFENIAFGLRVQKMAREEIDRKVRAVSAILNIEDKLDHTPRQLSGGERQRVATGRAIVRDPSLFLFDEPLSNLDARLRLELRKEFLQLQQRIRKTSLYVTHDQIEALALGDLIVVLNEGRIQQVSAPRELYDEPRNLFVAGFIGTPPMNLLEMKVEQGGVGPALRKGDFRLALPPSVARRLGPRPPARVFFGIRPSAVTLAGGADAGSSVATGDVELTELLGAEMLVYLRLADGVEIRATFPQDQWPAEARRVEVAFPEAKMYLFGGDGRRL